MALPDLIILGGAPGVGKSTLMSKLRAHFQNPPTIEFSDVRNLYLDSKWERASPSEERMAFDILLYALRIILSKGIKPVLLTDFQEQRLLTFQEAFREYRYRIVTLYAEEDELVRERVIARDDGFKDHEAAMRWNREVRLRASLPREDKIRVDQLSEAAVFERCLETLRLSNRIP
jgi:predicted kinase